MSFKDGEKGFYYSLKSTMKIIFDGASLEITVSNVILEGNERYSYDYDLVLLFDVIERHFYGNGLVLVSPEDALVTLTRHTIDYEYPRLEQPGNLQAPGLMSRWSIVFVIIVQTHGNLRSSFFVPCSRFSILADMKLLEGAADISCIKCQVTPASKANDGQLSICRLRHHQRFLFVCGGFLRVYLSQKKIKTVTLNIMMSQIMSKTRGVENHKSLKFTSPLSFKKQQKRTCLPADKDTLRHYEHKWAREKSTHLQISTDGVTPVHLSRQQRRVAVQRVPIRPAEGSRPLEVYAPQHKEQPRVARSKPATKPLVMCKYHRQFCAVNHAIPSKYREKKRECAEPACCMLPIRTCSDSRQARQLITTYKWRPGRVRAKVSAQDEGWIPEVSHVQRQQYMEDQEKKNLFDNLPEVYEEFGGAAYTPPRNSKRWRRSRGIKPVRVKPARPKPWLPTEIMGLKVYSKAYDSSPSSSSDPDSLPETDEEEDYGPSRFWANTTPRNARSVLPSMSAKEREISLIHHANLIEYLSLKSISKISIPLRQVLNRVKTRMPVKLVRHRVYVHNEYLCEDTELMLPHNSQKIIKECMRVAEYSPQSITNNTIKDLIGQYIRDEVSKVVSAKIEQRIKTMFWSNIIADIIHIISASMALYRSWDKWEAFIHVLSIISSIGRTILCIFSLSTLPEAFTETLTSCVWKEISTNLPNLSHAFTPPQTPSMTRIPSSSGEELAEAAYSTSPSSSEWDMRVEGLKPETIIKICIGVVCAGITAFDLSKGTTIGKNFVLSNNLSKALKENVTGMQELVEELSHDVFGYTIGRKFSVMQTAKEYHAKTIEYISKKAADYVCNIPLFYEMKAHFVKVDTYLRTLNCGTSTLTEGEKFALTQLRSTHATAEVYLLSMKQHLQTQVGRQETVPCIFWGLRGAGKTDFCSRYLGSKIAQKKGWIESMYSINFSREGGHWLPYDGQCVGMYDEFLAAKDKDPMLQHYNQLFSPSPFNLEAADLPHKVQPCQLKAVFLTANQPYVNLQATLTQGAESGFYSRGVWYHLINIDQRVDATRENIPRADDYSNLRFRIYSKPGQPDIQAYLQRLTSGFIDNYSASRYKGKNDEPHTDLDGTVYPTYESGVHWYKSRDIWIKEFTAEQLVDHILEQINVKEARHAQERDKRSRRLMEELYVEGVGQQEYVDMCSERGILTSEAKQFWIERVPLRIESMNTQNYYSLFYGPIGTGKSVAAMKVAKWISQLLKMPVVKVTDWKTAVPVSVPSIIITDDVALEEYKYIKFVNACATPSLFINCINLKCKSYMTRFVSPKSLVEFMDEGKIWGPIRWLNNMIFPRQCWSTNMEQMRVGPPTEAYWRRIGLPGYVKFKIGNDVRAVYVDPEYNKAIGFENGYIARDHRRDGYMYTINELAQEIASGYVPLLEKAEKVSLHEVNSEEMGRLAVGNADVQVVASNTEELVSFVNDTYRIVQASLRSAKQGKLVLDDKGCGVCVSSRLAMAQYTLDPAMFKLRSITNREEIVEMAMRTYNTLLYAGPQFTCNIRANDFEAWCENKTISYVSAIQCSEQTYNYKVEAGHVDVYLQQKRLMHMPISDYVNFTNICWSGDFKNYPLQLVYYLRSQEEEISRHPIVSANLALHRTVVMSVAEVHKEVEIFTTLWNKFKTSWIFWVVCAILALCTGTLIYQIIRWMVPAKPKEVTISGVPTFQVYCESTRRTCPASCEVISEDQSQVTAKVTLKTDEGISAGDENGIRDQVEDYLSRNFDVDKEMNIVFAYESWQDKGARARRARPARVNLPRLVPEKSIRASKRIADQKIQERDYEKEPVVPNACRTVPDLVEERDVMQQAQKKITDNIIQLRNYSLESAMYGLVLKSRTVIFPAHLVRDELKGFVNQLEATYDGPSGPVTVPVTVKFISRPQEIAVGELAPAAKQFKDITSMFVPEVRAKSVTQARFIRHGQYDLVCPVTVTYLDRPVYQRPERVDKDGYVVVNVSAPVYRAVFGQATKTTQEGDCGQIYMSNLGQPYVIGMHYAGHRTMPLSALISLTQEMVLDLCCEFTAEAKTSTLVPFTHSEILNNTGVKQVMYTETAKLIEEAVVVAPPTVCDVFMPTPKLSTSGKGTQLEYLGYTPLYTRSFKGENKHVPSVFSPYSTFSNMVRPSFLDPKKVINPSKLVVDNYGNPSIIWTQVNKYNDSIPRSQRLCDLLPEVENEMNDYYLSMYNSKAHRFLDDKEITNGLVFKHDELWGELGSLDFEASAGWWAATQLKAMDKTHVYEKDPVLTKAYIEASRGKDLYSYKTSKIGIEMAKRRNDKIDNAKRGVRIVHICKDNLKDELLPNQKAIEGRTRLFVALDDADTSLCRKYFGTMMAVMKKRHSIGHCQVGIDPHVEWHSLYNRLSLISDFGEAGDFSAWDKHLLADVIRMALRIMGYVITYNMSSELKAEFYRVLPIIQQDICMSLSFCDGVFYVKQRGSNSGNPLTSIVNSVVNDIYRITVCKIAIEQWRENHPSRMPELTSKLSSFRKYHDWVNYGDDIASVLDPRVLEVLNFRIFARIYQDHLGITYTSPDKSDKTYTWKYLCELTFLSRAFAIQENGLVYGSLKMETFAGMFHWSTADTYEQYVSILNALRTEIVLADERWYDQLSREFMSFIDIVYKKFGRKPAVNPLPSYIINRTEQTRLAFEHMWEIPPSQF